MEISYHVIYRHFWSPDHFRRPPAGASLSGLAFEGATPFLGYMNVVFPPNEAKGDFIKEALLVRARGGERV